MKFDYVIGNPPYQEDVQRSNGYAAPVYHHFMNAAFSLSEKVMMIHPARFLY